MRLRTTWALGALAALTTGGACAQQQALPQRASGVVFHDRNGNRKRDPDEKGIAGIRVSNQRDITTTDRDGRYTLPVDDDTILFVIKPRGWATPLNTEKLPRFYYIHKPNGSPRRKYPGVPPTGPLPASVDFPLTPSKEPSVFRALMFGDPQPRNQREVEYVARDVVEELIGTTDASFGVTLGDIAFNNLETMRPQNSAIAMIGLPWYNVLGNHDLNMDAPNDEESDETFESIYGPSYYSFDYGPVHFIVLDDVMWQGVDANGRPLSYKGGFGEEQLAFVKNDLAMIPKDQLVVLMMHIPISRGSVENDERERMFRLLEPRPYSLSIAAHAHIQEHQFLAAEDGWRGAKPHHHVINVTVCGDWWQGAPDEKGIPHATMRDGAPNGYSIFTFDGKNYDIQYKVARRPASYQMNIFAPEDVESARTAETEVLVNVFNGSERSTVEMRLGDFGTWTRLERVPRVDPYYAALKESESSQNPPNGLRLSNPVRSTHLWRGLLPSGAPAGTHTLHVRTTDMFGKTYKDSRIVRVLP